MVDALALTPVGWGGRVLEVEDEGVAGGGWGGWVRWFLLM